MTDRPEAPQGAAEAPLNSKKPWERLEGESIQAFKAFSAFVDLGDRRTLAGTEDELEKRRAEAAGRKPKGRKPGATNCRSGTIREWSRMFSWFFRAAAWDEELDRAKRQTQFKEIEEMARRHASVALLALSKAVERLQRMTEQDIDTITPLAAMKMIETAVKIERQARGVPGEIIQQDGEQKVTVQDAIRAKARKLSTDDLAKLEALLGDEDSGVDQE